MMLGDILGGLIDTASAEGVLAAIGSPELLARVRQEAAAGRLSPGAFVAARVRHMLDQAGEEVWLDLLGLMSSSPQPGAAALAAMLSRAFPAPTGATLPQPVGSR
jgi:hypothetical protein